MRVLGLGLRQADGARDGIGGVDEFAGARDQDDAAHLRLERIDGAVDLEGELRQAVAEILQRHALEDDVGDAAIGRRVVGAFAGDDEAVGRLVLAAGVEAPVVVGEVELLAVGPDAAEAGDLALAQRDGEVGVVEKLLGGRLRRSALAAARRDALLLDVGRPDHLAAEPRAAVEARDRCAFGGGGDLEIGEARARARATAGCAEQRLVDEGAGERADLRADGGAGDGGAEQRDAGRQERTADGGAGCRESERRHQPVTPGKENAPAMRRRHQFVSGTSDTGAPSMAWMMVRTGQDARRAWRHMRWR